MFYLLLMVPQSFVYKTLINTLDLWFKIQTKICLLFILHLASVSVQVHPIWYCMTRMATEGEWKESDYDQNICFVSSFMTLGLAPACVPKNPGRGGSQGPWSFVYKTLIIRLGLKDWQRLAWWPPSEPASRLAVMLTPGLPTEGHCQHRSDRILGPKVT